MYDLKKIYERVLNKTPHLGKFQLNEIYSYKVLNEQAPFLSLPEEFQFTTGNVGLRGNWDLLQRSLFERRLSGSGRGEYSVAALLISILDPNKYNEFLQQGVDGPGATGTINAAKYMDSKEMIQGSAVSYDVFFSEYDIKYEVKEIGGAAGTKDVRTGVRGKVAARVLLDKIYTSVNSVYSKYKALDPETKNLVDQIKTPAGLTIGSILQKAYTYTTEKPGEFAYGAAFSREKAKPERRYKKGYGWIEPEAPSEKNVPELSFLPSLIHSLITNKEIKEVMPETAQWIKDIYTTDNFKARVIDAYARDFLKVSTTDPETKLSDFILQCALSVFKDSETFKKEVQNYFIPGTEEHKSALNALFPVTGVFAVDPTSYMYDGAIDLERGLQITNITQGGFKVGPRGAPAED